MASSTKTKRNLASTLLVCVITALSPQRAGAVPQLGLQLGGSRDCAGVQGNEGECRNYRRAEFTLNVAHFKPRAQGSFADRYKQVAGKGVDAGGEVIKTAPQAGLEMLSVPTGGNSGWVVLVAVPVVMLAVALFGLAIMAVSVVLGAVAILITTVFGAENAIGLYYAVDRSSEGEPQVELRHYGLELSAFPLQDVWLRFHLAGGIVNTADATKKGIAFKTGFGVVPPPDRFGPMLVGEAERMRMRDQEGKWQESRQLTLSAGLMMGF